LGEWDKSEQYYNEALSISQKQKEFQATAGVQIGIGTLYFDKGEYAKAREHLEKGIEIVEKAGAKSVKMLFSSSLIMTYIELGEIEKARNLIGEVCKFAVELKYARALIATTDMLRAVQFRAQKKWKQSIEHFEKVLQEFETLEARRWNAYQFAKYFLLEYARVYLERDQEGDREKARGLLEESLKILQKVGAKKDIEKVKSRLAYIETGDEMLEPKHVAKVPEIVLPSHITTGYGELDDLLFGGIPRNYAVILTSPSCDERDLLVRRFLETGAKKGQVTFHIISKATGTQKLAEAFQSSHTLFLCNPEADSIIKSLPNVHKLKGVENLTDINIALTSALRKLGDSHKEPRRACIEILSDVLLQHHAVQTRKWLNALIPKLKSKGFTTLAVMDPEMHPPQEVRAILGLFDGEISIYRKSTDKGLEKFLKIEKLTNQKYSDKELPLRRET
jgi:tetratricopeptide (TPR) repeat protein